MKSKVKVSELFILAAIDKATSNTEPLKPTIIIILTEKMRYSCLGCMGLEISTPNLENMAKNGNLFTFFQRLLSLFFTKQFCYFIQLVQRRCCFNV